MPARVRRLLRNLLLLLCLSHPTGVRAQGQPVTAPPSEAQGNPVVTSDDRGGAFVSYKTASLKLGAVHVNTAGIPDGRGDLGPFVPPIDLEAGLPPRVLALRDTALRFAADRASLGRPLLAQYRSNGQLMAGYPASLTTMPFRHPAMVPGRRGGTVLLAKDSDTTSFWTLRSAVLRADGQVDTLTEIRSSQQFFNNDLIAACRDSSGGMLAAMSFYDGVATGSKEIGVIRVAADGSHPWGQNLRIIVIATRDQTDVQVAPDGVGGMLMAWTDPRSNVVGRSTDIFAHHVNKDGFRVIGWSYYGSPLCDAPGAQSEPRMAPDGTGGAWVVWYDQRASVDGDLRITHVLSDGRFAPGFAVGGTVLCDAPGIQRETAIVGDGGGGCFVVWRDHRNGDADVYAQHLTAAGTVAAGWEANGRAVCVAPGTQDQPAIGSVLTGRAIVAWRDARTAPARIYTATLTDATVVDAPPSAIAALRIQPLGTRAVRVTLPSGEATLELLDVAGRVLERTPLQGPLEGAEHVLANGLRPGLYFARLRQGTAAATARVTVLR
jgi:hypothetical protein